MLEKLEKTYLFLRQEELDDTIVRTYRANEMDHYLHWTNRERYAFMLTKLPSGPFRVRIQGLLDETVARLAEVEAIMDATFLQLPRTPVAIQASLKRVIAEEATSKK